MEVVGVDGYKHGWVAVPLLDGRFTDGDLFAQFDTLRKKYVNARVIAVDVPIGLPAIGHRGADKEAYRILGPRRNSVFFVPPRAVLDAPTYQEALTLARNLGTSLTKQMYGFRLKILEVDNLTITEDRIAEVHPEVSFWALNGNRPMKYPKRTWNGLHERIQLLREEGLELPGQLDKIGIAFTDDVIDAAAAAWSATRIARGNAQTLPETPEVSLHDRSIAIWY